MNRVLNYIGANYEIVNWLDSGSAPGSSHDVDSSDGTGLIKSSWIFNDFFGQKPPGCSDGSTYNRSTTRGGDGLLQKETINGHVSPTENFEYIESDVGDSAARIAQVELTGQGIRHLQNYHASMGTTPSCAEVNPV